MPEGVVEFKMLGPLEVWRADTRVLLHGLRQERALLALLFDADRTVSLGKLIEAVWDDAPPASARRQVQDVVARLRRLLSGPGGPPVVITTEPGGYRLHLGPHRFDAAGFAELVSDAADPARSGAEALALLRAALSLWQAPALTGTCGLALEPAACLWDERRLSAMQDCLRLEAEAGRTAEAARELQSLVSAHPLREELVVLLMRILAGQGRRAEAVEAYLALRRRLADDLGIDPGPAARQAYEAVLHDADDRPSTPRTNPPGAVAPTPACPAQLPAAATDEQAAAGPRRAARFTLPADTIAFTGRTHEIHTMTATVTGQHGGVVTIHAIDGMPGVGKTALAIHAAHQLTGRFPDRQIFVDLHAHTPDKPPTAPADALAELLTADGVDPRQLPDTLDARAGMWRDRLAGTHTLIVLDNAASTSQITPLLPGTPGCLVLVTSRRRLADLAATHLFLDILPAADAPAMFQRLAPRAYGQADLVADVVEVCGYLPLAIAITASLYSRRPSWTLKQLIAEIQGRRLTATGEHHTVKAAFDLSYRHLPEPRQRFFRLLGLHPGIDIDGYAAAALTDVPYEQALAELDELYNDHLLGEPAYRRYRMHDLIRDYTLTEATVHDPPEVREQAVRRLLDYYQHTAARADAYLTRHTRPAASPTPAPVAAPQLNGWDQAAAWLRTERPNLLAAIHHTTTHQLHHHTIGLTAGIAALLYTDGPWTLAADLHHAAAAIAQQCGDLHAQAGALYELGNMRWLAGDYPGAADLLGQALNLYRAVGDRLGQANALNEQGGVRYLAGDFLGATDKLEQALDLYRAIGDRRGEAYALHDLGTIRYPAGDYLGAAARLEQALELHRAIGNWHGQALALGELGVVRRLTGDYPGAADQLEQALNLFQAIGNRRGQAMTLVTLGVVRRMTGDYPGAAARLEQALELHRAIGNPHGEANALTQLGAVRYLTGDYPSAEDLFQRTLAALREVGAPDDEAETLNHLATLHRLTEHPDQAQALHHQALAIARTIHLRLEEAHALEGIGRAALDLDDTTTAHAHLRQALDIYHELGVPELTRLTTELATLEGRSFKIRRSGSEDLQGVDPNPVD